jgi:ABC-2 type transport system permease protein
MGLCTAFAVAAFGMLLASICRTRAQLGALSTLLILTMSAIGGSMFPRFLMPEAMQKAGLWTINAWAIDGFTKVFWRDLPVRELWPQVSVLLAVGIVLFAVARRSPAAGSSHSLSFRSDLHEGARMPHSSTSGRPQRRITA